MFRSEVLRIRDFRRLWIGQAVSQFGDAVYGLLFLFIVDKLTNSPAMVGYLGAVEALPFLLLGPYAGVVADRIDRRKIMLAADVGSAVVLLNLVLAMQAGGNPPIWLIFVAAAVLKSLNVFFGPAKSGAIPNLVPAEKLMEANGLSTATQNLMPIMGIALSAVGLGALYELVPPTRFFQIAALANALSFLISALCIAPLPPLVPKREEADAHAKNEAVEGFRYVRRDPVLWPALILGALLNLFFAPYMIITIRANRAWFGGQYWTLAVTELCFFVAMVLMSLAIGKRNFKRPGIGFALGLGAIGLFVAFMAFSRLLPIYCLWNIACGIALPFATIPMTTYTQLRVPDAFRGRVSSAQMIASMGVMPLSMGAAGWLLDKVGLQTMYLIMGIGGLASALGALLNRPFREAEMPEVAPSGDIVPALPAEKQETPVLTSANP